MGPFFVQILNKDKTMEDEWISCPKTKYNDTFIEVSSTEFKKTYRFHCNMQPTTKQEG